ncbi:leucine-rich repeat domain-containing protein [Actinomadura madurae]|uniref:leucine-rich repeat domain-containing protein n=1 Tax=Actinomadura madurae TaxID=1993 RepID=UPI000D810174|nr:Uncharacterised protein [Actinomadura madurae]
MSAYLRAEADDLGTADHRLETLDLRYCRIGNTGLEASPRPPLFNGVRRLRLQNNVITAKGMPALHRFEMCPCEPDAGIWLQRPNGGAVRKRSAYRLVISPCCVMDH